MIQPLGYSNKTVFQSSASQSVKPAGQRTDFAGSEKIQPGVNKKADGKEHLSYWRSLGISSLFGASAMGFATIFCQKWRTSIGFGAVIAGLCMLFDLPDTLFIGRK